ncbi:MAG: ABC transporter permease subunit [Sneathiellaceae bacterium]
MSPSRDPKAAQPDPAAGHGRARRKHRVRLIADRLLVGLALLALWQVASLASGSYWISPPLETLQRLAELALEGQLAMHAGYTLRAALFGFLIGGIPGLLLPFLLRRLPLLAEIVDPFMTAGYGLPKLALAPLLMLWFGIGIESKVALVASVIFFLVYFSTAAGIRSVDIRHLRMAQIAGASEAQLARKIIWPAAVPFVFAGLRISLPYAIGGAVIAELISSNRGLGYLVQLGAMNFDTSTVFAALAAIALIVLTANWLVVRAETHLLRWRPPQEPALGEIPA